MKLKKSLLKVTGLTLICLLIYAGWIKYRSTQYSDGGLPLAIRWEGFFHDMNHRDLGTSMNQCLNEPYFKEGLLMRSATWFSGRGCSKVGNPDVIYSLNFSPERNERYFCQQGDNKKIGRY